MDAGTNSDPSPDRWLAAVDDYFGQLEATLDQLDSAAQQFLAQTAAGQFEQLPASCQAMTESAHRLGHLLDARQDILQSIGETTGSRPRSLRGALERLNQSDRLATADRLAQRVEQARQRSLTLFVTQYQLMGASEEVLDCLLNRQPDPGTYGKETRRGGGGLMDDAA